MRNHCAAFLAAVGGIAGLSIGLAGPAVAQPASMASADAPVTVGSWPQKPITLLMAAPAGSPSDIVARMLAERMQPMFKQPIVADNRPGANGSIAATEVARAAPDGQTWMFATDSVYTINPYVYKRLSYKPEQLDPVLVAARLDQLLVCNPKTGIKTLKEFLGAARAKKMNYASGGVGSPGHMAMGMLIAATGVEMNHVPYKGPAGAMNDVLAGEVPCGFLARATVLPFVQRGQLNAIALSGTKRSPAMPTVPTVAESGYPAYDATFSLVLFAPHGTPPAIVTAFTREMRRALEQPETLERLKVQDLEAVGDSPDEAAASMGKTALRWADVVHKINLHLE